jgi:DNA-binding NarL/FixJ family response regulator
MGGLNERAITVVIADDHALFRSGVVAILDGTPDIEVVAEAASGEAAVAAVVEHDPDVVLMDVMMPGMNGLAATEQCRSAHPSVADIVMTMMDDAATIFSAMCAGARGYLVKGTGKETMVRAIRAAANGEVLLSAEVAERALGFFHAGSGPRARPLPDLTDREFEVLELVAQGKSNAETGSALGLSAKTVANHLSRVFTKLQVTDRAQAMVVAHERGLSPHSDLPGSRER